eukprot:TRINITY_DN62992_c0_g1_i1.p1 TRINITY_DN62992_c0_g1~~TRINITY_DN62992_c0_g1_i1.p1  ORF type:complete len:109 (+),score=19.24 TRINITY_DN62992_c0_g1_i1:167-493(+)
MTAGYKAAAILCLLQRRLTQEIRGGSQNAESSILWSRQVGKALGLSTDSPVQILLNLPADQSTNLACLFRAADSLNATGPARVSYTHLRAHETPEHLVCRLLLEKKNI